MDLSPAHEVHVAIRGETGLVPARNELPRDRLHAGVDAARFDQVTETIRLVQPDVLVNCVGVVKQSPVAQDPASSLELNSLLPHRLARACLASRCRLIHISTDCVFSGAKGSYSETDLPDPVDFYGHSKLLGEVTGPGCLTLRTSFVGRELRDGRGLLEWFLAQQGRIRGYTRAVFSGLTTTELSRVIHQRVLPRGDLHGIYHVAAAAISKYDLLLLAREAFGKTIEIDRDTEFVCDRSLNGARFAEATGYQSPDWPEMIGEVAGDSGFYEAVRGERQGAAERQ
jgi:dTDP-4-dehydrorhamnose reductase